jgi:predicted amidophosphoribosyltransferase
MQQCPNCWEPMSITANVCPHCRHSESIADLPAKRRPGSLFWLSSVLIVALGFLLVRYLGFA